MRTAAEIEALVDAFERCTLPKAEWTHREHLTVALWYLLRHSPAEATLLIRSGIQRYNLSTSNPTGYHETITLAWIAVITRFLAERERGADIARLTQELLEECGEKLYLLRYYSCDLLMSPAARQGWVEPDAMPLP